MQFLSPQQRHSTGVAALSLMVSAASVFGLDASSPWVLLLVVVSVALIGVPHGGLDHWTGRKLLHQRLGRLWGPAFFGSYLAVVLIVVAGWVTVPLLTAVAFFFVSAWHFGLEDERGELSPRWVNHVAAVAVGGLVIWIPALTQPERMSEILQVIVPPEILNAPAILSPTQATALCVVPLALIVAFRDLESGDTSRVLRNTALIGLFAVADPIISFAVYFCGWHSIRGLRELAETHDKTPFRLAVATAPLTIGAITFSVAGWLLLGSNGSVPDAVIRALFISLSAIAVPHLILHGPIKGWLGRQDRTQDYAMKLKAARC